MKIGISACSNGHLPEWQDQITELEQVFDNMNIETALSLHIMRTIDEYSGTDKERAEDLMKFYKEDEIDAIYDISGGDLANGVLKYLDYDTITKTDKTFWGYSDLTTVINAIYTMTGKPGVLYQIKNII